MEFFDFEPQVAVAWVTAIGAIIVAFMVRRNQNTTVDVNSLVEQIAEARKEAELARAEAKAALSENLWLRSEIQRLASLEERLEDGIDARDQRIADLEDAIDSRDSRWSDLEERVRLLEMWVRAQGADPEAIVDEMRRRSG